MTNYKHYKYKNKYIELKKTVEKGGALNTNIKYLQNTNHCFHDVVIVAMLGTGDQIIVQLINDKYNLIKNKNDNDKTPKEWTIEYLYFMSQEIQKENVNNEYCEIYTVKQKEKYMKHIRDYCNEISKNKNFATYTSCQSLNEEYIQGSGNEHLLINMYMSALDANLDILVHNDKTNQIDVINTNCVNAQNIFVEQELPIYETINDYENVNISGDNQKVNDINTYIKKAIKRSSTDILYNDYDYYYWYSNYTEGGFGIYDKIFSNEKMGNVIYIQNFRKLNLETRAYQFYDNKTKSIINLNPREIIKNIFQEYNTLESNWNDLLTKINNDKNIPIITIYAFGEYNVPIPQFVQRLGKYDYRLKSVITDHPLSGYNHVRNYIFDYENDTCNVYVVDPIENKKIWLLISDNEFNKVMKILQTHYFKNKSIYVYHQQN